MGTSWFGVAVKLPVGLLKYIDAYLFGTLLCVLCLVLIARTPNAITFNDFHDISKLSQLVFLSVIGLYYFAGGPVKSCTLRYTRFSRMQFPLRTIDDDLPR